MRTAGYSFLELLTALGLMSLLVGLAVPNLRALSEPWALDGASRQVAAAFRVARQRAIARNVRHRVAFAAPRAVRLEREAEPGTFVPDGTEQELPAAVSLGAWKPKYPVFDTRGMLAAPATIPVKSSTAKKTVRVNVLGRTTID